MEDAWKWGGEGDSGDKSQFGDQGNGSGDSDEVKSRRERVE